MAWLPVDALESGMTLAADLKGPDGSMLLPKGVVLSESHIASLRRRGVTRADVGSDAADGPAGVASLDPALAEASLPSVSRRFAVNDTDHPAVAALFEAAVLQQARSLAAGGSLPPDFFPNPRAESLNDLFFREEGSVKDLVASEVKLASFPDIYFKIRQVLDSPVSSPSQVADVVIKDTSLSAKLLKLVNSPFYGLPQRIDSISRAAKAAPRKPGIADQAGVNKVIAHGVPPSGSLRQAKKGRRNLSRWMAGDTAREGVKSSKQIGHLVQRPDFDLAGSRHGIGAAFYPGHRLVHVLDVPEPEAGNQLLGFGEGPVNDQPVGAVKRDALAVRRGFEAVGRAQDAGLFQFGIEFAHCLEHRVRLGRANKALFAVLGSLHEHHYTHRRLLGLASA